MAGIGGVPSGAVAPPSITADRLTFRPAGTAGPTPIRDLSFHLPAGETLLVSGPTGSGKSTLLRLIAGLAAYAPGPEVAGSLAVTFPDDVDEPLDPLPRPRPGRVALVHQEPGDGLIGLDVLSALAFPLETHGRPAGETLQRVEAALDAFGILHLVGRDVATLSGGERRRVALAGVEALDAPLVLLDEPLADLDPSGTRRVLADLHRLQHERTVVVAEHRTTLIAPLVDQTLHLITDDGGTRRRQALEVPRQDDPGPRLVARGLTLHRGERVFLDDARFALDPGVWGLLGPNGAGKSTLLAALAGLFAPVAGEVTVDGVPVWTTAPRRVRRGRRTERFLRERLQVAFQDPREAFFASTVLDELAAPLVKLRDVEPTQARIRAHDALQQAGCADLEGRSPLRLSGGEARIVQLLGTLLVRPRVLFVDEPTHGLDPGVRAVLTATLDRFAKEGGLVVVATHEPEVLPDGTRFLFLPGDGSCAVGDAARPGAKGPRAAGYTGGESVREVHL